MAMSVDPNNHRCFTTFPSILQAWSAPQVVQLWDISRYSWVTINATIQIFRCTSSPITAAPGSLFGLALGLRKLFRAAKVKTN